MISLTQVCEDSMDPRPTNLNILATHPTALICHEEGCGG